MAKKYLKIAMAYVGVIVGAGLSSGQDLMQYFVSFGKQGILGVAILAILNIVFGKIIVTLGCYYDSDSHQDVLEQVAHPIITKIIDYTLIVSGFIIFFVMVAGAGANLHQQFAFPSWLGALICALLVIIVSFLDFDKITSVLGYIGVLLLGVLLVAWIREKKNIMKEKMLRRKMIAVEKKKYDDNQEYTKKDKKLFKKLAEESVLDASDIKREVKDVVKEEQENN